MNNFKSTRSVVSNILAILSIVFMFAGCTHEVYQDSILDFSADKGHGAGISEKDLENFASSIRPVNSQAESHYKMAIHLQKRGKHGLAIGELKNALQIDPEFAKAFNAMGISYDNRRLYQQAIICYRKALMLEPDLDYVYNNLGYSYLLNTNIKDAIEAFQKAIELDGSNPRYRNNLGLAYVMNGQNDKAYEQFKIVKDETGADEKMAKLMYRMGKVKFNQFLAKKSETEMTATPSADIHPVVSESKNSNTESTTAFTDSANPEDLKDQMLASEYVPPEEGRGNDDLPAPETEEEQPTILVTKTRPVQQELEIETQPKNYTSDSDAPMYFLSVFEPSFEPGSELKDDAEKEKTGEQSPPERNEDHGKSLVTADAPLTAVNPPAMKAGNPKNPKAEIRVKANSVLTARKDVSEAGLKLENAKVEIEIEVANGNGQTGAARKLGNYLSGKGFNVVKVTNARSFDHSTSKIFYCDVKIEEVYKLIQMMPIDKRRRNLIKLNHLGNRIKIIVGHDLI